MLQPSGTSFFFLQKYAIVVGGCWWKNYLPIYKSLKKNDISLWEDFFLYIMSTYEHFL